jgi:hypothetical protein
MLKKILMSYDENYTPNVDVEETIGVKRKKNSKRKIEGDYVYKFCFKDRNGAEQRIMLLC